MTTHCPKKAAKFRDKQTIKIALASYPGAGNTWLRHLIQQTTGIVNTGKLLWCR
jgi:hypothetical protein